MWPRFRGGSSVIRLGLLFGGMHQREQRLSIEVGLRCFESPTFRGGRRLDDDTDNVTPNGQPGSQRNELRLAILDALDLGLRSGRPVDPERLPEVQAGGLVLELVMQ